MPSRELPVEVARRLRRSWTDAPPADDTVFPQARWQACCAAGVTAWTIPEAEGGRGDTPSEWLDGCLELARGDLLVAFVLSQFQAACQRLAAASSLALRQRWLPRLASGTAMATVGISHLTTSRQHLPRPAVEVQTHADGFRLSGTIPWVTAGLRADVLVLGGTFTDGRQILAAVPADRPGLQPQPPWKLLALTGSETGTVKLQDVNVAPDEVIAGPVPHVLSTLPGGGAGSLTTSALALGHAWHGIDCLHQEARGRPSLDRTVAALEREAQELRGALLATAQGTAGATWSAETLRARATDLTLRATQALLTATKGAGFVQGHPAERLAREALFFLVWSCPQAVAAQLLDNFAGCADEDAP